MRKILVIFLLMAYAVSSSGMTLHFHYCCGKLKNVELTPVLPKDCGKHQNNMGKKSCCENRSVELRINTDQRTSQNTFKYTQPAAEALFVSPFNTQVILPAPDPAGLQIFSPPPSRPLFLLNCVYRR